jgi:hypothetical protein
MQTNGVNKPIWDTESGWGTAHDLPNTGKQAAQLARHLLLMWSVGVSRCYWYAWDNDTWGTLWDSSSGIHPAGTAYAQVQSWMLGATLTSPCSQMSNGIWSCSFIRSGSSQALAIWRPAGPTRFNPPGTFHKYRNLKGDCRPINGSIVVGPEPVLLESTGPA